jgi:formate dehydrogenase subunit gamma
MDRVQVRGRDFTAYRIGGAVAALLLALALVWQAVLLLSGDTLVTPESRWGAVRTEGAPASGATAPHKAAPEGAGEVDAQSAADPGYESGLLARETLAARTRLQDERFRTGPSPGGDAPPLALGPEEWLVERPMEGGEIFPQAWRTPDEDVIALLRPRDEVIGVSSLPYVNAELFERPAARAWRVGLADWATHVGALAILGFAFLLAATLAIRGRVPIAEGRSGRTVKRFGFWERANHWMTAASFIGLALTGVAIGYGDTLVRPLFGEAALGALGWASTWAHMALGPSFTFGVLLMAAFWLRGNLPERLDLPWLARGGGFFSDSPGKNPSARKFNAGQKLIFWSAVLGGGLMIASGLLLMFPYWLLDLGWMSWAMLTHAIVGALLIAIFLGHIYIGSVGMHGAIEAMWGGEVDRNWAAEHHDLWLEEVTGSSEPDAPQARLSRARRAGL